MPTTWFKSSFLQFIDSRCISLMQGRTFDVTAYVKLETNEGTPYICNPDGETCPEVGYKLEGDSILRFDIAEVSSTQSIEGYQRIEGSLTINKEMMNAESMGLYVRSNVEGVKMYVDNISVRLEGYLEKCSDLIANSDMEEDWREFWDKIGLGSFAQVAGYNSDTAIRYSGIGRSGFKYNSDSNMDYSCLTPGSTWEITARMKLTNKRNGVETSCSTRWTCPRVRIELRDASSAIVMSVSIREYESPVWNSRTFNRFRTKVTLPWGWDGSISDFSIGFVDLPLGNYLTVDDVHMQLVE